MRRHLTTLLPALPGVAALVVGWASFGGRVIDDAYISLVYANQLNQGHGLVFHPSLPVTEGYSNLLWTLMLALGMQTGLAGPTVAAGLGVLCAALALGMICLRVGGWKGAFLGLPIAASPIFGYWAGQGLEGSCVALLLTVGVLNLGRPAGWVAFGLLGVTRIEGILYGFVPLAWSLLHRRGTSGASRRWPPLWGIVALFGPTVAQLAFRVWAYGSMVPSTVLAKARVNGSPLEQGLRWIYRAPELEPVTVVAFVGAVVVMGYRILRKRPAEEQGEGAWAALVCLGIVAFAVGVRGDWMPNLRWLQPAIPLAWFAIARALPSRAGFCLLALGGALYAARVGIQEGNNPPAPRRWSTAVATLRYGPEPANIQAIQLFVVEELAPTDVVLAPDIGQLAWVSRNPVLDPQGLTWRSVALAMRQQAERGPGYTQSLQDIADTVQRLSPGVVAIPFSRQTGMALGPVGVALMGGTGTEAASWFTQGWTAGREAPYGENVLRYFRRNANNLAPTADERLVRYDRALVRMPDADVFRWRKAMLLRQLGRWEEADALQATIDPRFAPREVW